MDKIDLIIILLIIIIVIIIIIMIIIRRWSPPNSLGDPLTFKSKFYERDLE